MTVEVIPKNGKIQELSLPNKWWFDVLRSGVLTDILGDIPLTNDPLDVSDEDAKRLAVAMEKFSPPEGWGHSSGDPDGEVLKRDFIEFFEGCGGFETS